MESVPDYEDIKIKSTKSIMFLSVRNGYQEMWIFISLGFAFLLGSLKTIPSALLERELNFKQLSTVDIVENILFYTIAVGCALLGLGALSYAIATFIRSIVGLILIYRFKPLKIKIYFSINSLKILFRYGIPFQLNSFIALAKDRLSNLLVAGIIGTQGFGLISFAQKAPRMPLTLMDSMMKVTFPTFSRLQENEEMHKRSISRSTYFIALFVFPAITGIALVASDFIHLIPKYSKWEPAIIPLYLYSLSFIIASVTTPLTNAFNAVGKILTSTKMMIIWTVLTWIFYPILSYKFGYIGTSIAALIVGSSSFIVWYLAYKYFKVNIIKVIIHPIISTSIMLFLLIGINTLHLSPIISIISKVFTSVIMYGLYHFFLSKSEMSWFINQIKCLYQKK